MDDTHFNPESHFNHRSRVRTLALCYCVFGCLYRSSPNDLTSRFCLKYSWLFCEWIDAAPLFRCRLLDNNEFGKSGHKEGPRFFELLISNRRERLDNGLDVLSRYSVRMLFSDYLNKL